jgi:purine-binding chemotaxis protein CheW
MGQDPTDGQLVVFSLGTEEYALPIGHVQEIIRYTEPRSVASNVPSIRGVISLRGKIVPVCDLASHLGVGANGADDAKIIVVETTGATAGVVVDDVAEVLDVDESTIDQAPGAGNDAIRGIAKVDDRLIVLLDTDGVFEGIDLDVAA